MSVHGSAGIVVHGVLILLSISVVFPFLLMISGSLTQEEAINRIGVQLVPSHFSTAAYRYAFEFPKALLMSYGITALITVIGTVASLLLTTMLAYVMARRDYALSRVTTFVVFFTLLFNGGLVPFYILISRYLHLGNTIWSMIVPGLVNPFMVLIFKGFLSRMSFEVIEAAKIDGASEYRIFFGIVLPMAKPALATLTILVSFSYWNEWFNALLFVTNSNLYPLQLYIYNLGTQLSFLQSNPQLAQQLLGITDPASVPYVSAQLALTILAVAPFVVVFTLLRKYFQTGLTVGSLKG